MVIDAEYLKTLREANRNFHGDVIVGSGMFDEICRVYLAWLDAPESIINIGVGGDGRSDFGTAARLDTSPAGGDAYETASSVKAMHNRRVRLVEVKDG